MTMERTGFKRTEIGELPDDWQTCGLGAEGLVHRVGSGVTPTGGQRVYKQSGRPFVRSQNVGWGQLLLDDLAFIDDETHASFSASEIVERDVLLNITGASIGRCAVATADVAKGNVNQHVCEIRANQEKLDPSFLCNFILSQVGQRQIDSFQAGGNRQGLNFGQIRSLTVPIPPLPEQEAIATALSDVDALIEALDAAVAKKRAIKLGAMQQLLTGKTRLPGFDGEWTPRRVGSMLSFLPTANNPRKDLSGEGDLGYIHYGDVHAHATPILDCTKCSLPKISRSRVGNAVELRDGDLVFVDASEDMVGVGKSVEIANLNTQPVVAGLHTIACRGGTDCWAPGFKAYLQSIPAFKQALERVATGISVYAISKRQIGDVELALPDVREQAWITTILSDMDAEITALEQRREKTRAIKQGMMQALLTGRVRLVEPEAT
jgi:type I restriction enzyme, S subunit